MNVLTINATQQNGIISVSGTTDAEMYAVAISVYDESGANLITLETAATNNGIFSHEIEIVEGNYQICVADYNGGECMTTTVLVASEEEQSAVTEETTETAGTPETGYQTTANSEQQVTPDANASVSVFGICLAVIAVAAIVSAFILRRRFAERKVKNK